MMYLLEIFTALLIFGCAVVALFIALQGDAKLRILTGERTQARKACAENARLDFFITLPFDNIGKQEGTILDAYLRVYLPQEQYADLLLRGKVNLAGAEREDDYFEALLVPAGKKNNFILRFEAYAKNGKTLAEALGNAPDVDVALMADCRGRGELFTLREYFTLTAEELRALLAE